MEHCCKMMTDNVNYECDMHEDKYECPDVIIDYYPKQKKYGIIIHDGGTSMIAINYCPWCGKKIGENKF